MIVLSQSHRQTNKKVTLLTVGEGWRGVSGTERSVLEKDGSPATAVSASPFCREKMGMAFLSLGFYCATTDPALKGEDEAGWPGPA